MIKLITNYNQIARDLKKYKDVNKKIIAGTINKSAQQAVNQGKKEIRDKYTVKVSELNRRRVYKFNRASARRQSAQAIYRPVAIPLSGYKNRQLAAGVQVEVRKGHKKMLTGHFVNTSKRGNKFIARRKDERRYPIKKLFGAKVAHLFGSINVTKRIFKYYADNFERLYYQQSNRYGR